jgi:Asp-tRNA(Asn)/Glu-tRNA(Gln) amidotransferase A subunit family amidase
MKLHRLGLREAAQRIREGGLSSVELMRACLAQCAQLEPTIQAWQHLDAERAMELAEAADAARHSGKASGPLHGVPVAVKDIIDVAGMPTTMGSPIYANNVARESARVVARLEQAGAVVPGKTVTSEFAYYTPGKTRNPWNTAHTPGGSSMGSAAAVAAHMIPAALGTQTNGSVIRPAAFCGVVGFKPSYDAISTHGMLTFSATLDTVGVLTRSVADAAQLAAVIAEPDCKLCAEVAVLAAPPRLIAVRSPVWHLAELPQQTMFAQSIAALRAAGAQVDDIELPIRFADAHNVQRVIMAHEGAKNLGPVQRRNRGEMSARLNAFLDEGAAIDAASHRAALKLRGSLQEELARFVMGHDAIITLPAPGEAPADLTQTGNPAFCTIWTLLGAPAVSLPVGMGPHGLPLGLQVVGASRADDKTLAVAAWCEAQLPFQAVIRDQ